MGSKLKVKVLTAEAFQPYGQVIVVPETKPEAQDEVLSWWGKVASLSADGPVGVGILKVSRREFVVPKLERHVKTAEMLVPMKGDSILVVGKGTIKPDGEPEQMDAFYLKGEQIVIMDVGTWHWLPFPLDNEAFLVVVFRSSTPEDDLEFHELMEVVKLEL